MTAAFEITAFVVCAIIAVAGALGMTTTMSMFRSGIFLMASFIGVAGLFILLSADLIGLLQVMMYIGGFLVMILFMVLVMHDPGGSMMAGMDMAPLERWFSMGLVPRKPMGEGQGGHEHGDTDGDAPGAGASGHAGLHGSGQSADTTHGGHAHTHGREGAAKAIPHKTHGHRADHAAHPHEQTSNHHAGDHAGMDMGGMDMSMVTPVRPLAAWLAVAVGVVLVGMLILRPAWPLSDAAPDPDSARRVGHLLMEKYMVAFEGAGFLILIGIFGAVLLARPSVHPDDPSRAARVAIDEKPEPIRSDRPTSLAAPDQAAEHPHDHEVHRGHGEHAR